VNQKTEKSIPRDLSIVGRYINSVGGTYILHEGAIARYQSASRGLNLEFEIENLKNHTQLNWAYFISPQVTKNLAALSSGSGEVLFEQDNDLTKYRITNQSSTITLDHRDVTLALPTIGERIIDTEKIGPPIKIISRNQLHLTGREKSTLLVVRSDTFSGIINPAGEYFFDPEYSKEVNCQKLLLRSRYFMKIGTDRFVLQLYRKEGKYILLTTVSIGTGIYCRLLEDLDIN
jgi:hypothetical protein